jgi:transposase
VSRTRPPYPPEFRAEAVRLVRSSGLPLPELARELGVSPQSLRNWLGRAQIDAGEREGLTSDEREELRRLRRDNARLREGEAHPSRRLRSVEHSGPPQRAGVSTTTSLAGGPDAISRLAGV